MYKLQVYIDGQRLELFEDETISLNSSVQNIKDISKVFTDFTQSFNVPASSNNNKIFEHWYNADIIDGFNAKTRKDARLELNYKPFKEGKIQLEGAKLKNGIPELYKITFFGNLVNLSDLFGDDKLEVLPLTAFDHDYTSANVKTGITTGLFDGSVIYPLISSERNWQWDAKGTSLEDDDIRNTLLQVNNGISYLELKPAIKINNIIEAIETHYGITFSNNFFNTNNHIDELFIWLNKERGYINPFSEELKIFDNVDYKIDGNIFTILMLPEVGYEDVEYKIRVVNTTNGNEVTYTKKGDFFTGINLGVGLHDMYISSTIEFSFIFSYSIPSQQLSVISPITTITNGNTTISANLPDMTVTEFVGGLVKMFNLVVEPLTSTSFNLTPLNEWYNEGVAKDITKYIDISDLTINKPVLYKRINFKYQETDTIIGEQFRETNKIGYGDLEAEFVYDGGVLDIELPFENVMLENISSVLDNTFSNVLVGKIINKDLEPTEIKPLLFYNRNITNLDVGFMFKDEDNVQSEIKSYLNVGQENKTVTADITQSLNFGEEISTFNFAPPPLNENSELGSKVSLYSNYWEDYITDLYDNKRRVYKFDAIMPLSVIGNINLNDKLIIRDRVYIINTINTNLTTGKVKLELLNYIGAVSQEVPVNFNGLNYDLNFNIS